MLTCISKRSVVHLSLPPTYLQELSVRSNTSVEILGDSVDVPLRLRGLDVTTNLGNINVSQLMIAQNGLALISSSGEIDIANLGVNGKGYTNVNTNTRVYSGLGSITMANASFLDCDASVEGGAGTIEMSSITG